jgi:type I restriction enzyme S subunit
MSAEAIQLPDHRSLPALPPGWSETPVAQLVVKHFCGPSPECEERPIASEDEWGVLKTTAITWEGWNETAHKALPVQYWGLHDLEVHFGDVLVTKAGPRSRVGVVVHVTSQPKRLIVSGKMIGLRPRSDEVLPQVLAGALALRQPQDYIHARTTGMAESQVNFANDVLLETKVRIPELNEQTRIAAVLDTLDGVIAETETVIAKLRTVRAGLLHDLLTRGLDEHGQLRDPIAHPEQFQDSPLGQIPRGWEVLTLEQLTDPQAPICYGIVQAHDYIPEGVFVLAIRDIPGDFVSGVHRTALDIDANYARSRVRAGDVLISIKGTIGRIGLVPSHYSGNISRDLARIRPGKRVVPEFLMHLLRSPLGQKTLERAQVGTTRAELSIAPLKLLSFALPPMREQQIIAERLDRQEDLIAKHDQEKDKLNRLKSGLMTDLLTGRVRVPENLELAKARP